MEEKEDYLTNLDKEIFSLIDILWKIMKRREAEKDIGEGGRLLLLNLEEGREAVIERVKNRIEDARKLKDASLSKKEKAELQELLALGAEADASLERMRDALIHSYYTITQSHIPMAEA
jgi:hypothetical protein